MLAGLRKDNRPEKIRKFYRFCTARCFSIFNIESLILLRQAHINTFNKKIIAWFCATQRFTGVHK